MTRITNDYAAEPRHLINSQARWGAILAGVSVAIALLCFLHLFGLAIGVSLIDLSDAEVIGSGFGIGVMIWSVLSWCAALFLGAMLTARLSGEGSETVGLLNGVTLWATTTLLVMVLAYTGISAIVGGTFSLASSAVSATVSGVQSTGRAIGSAASSLSESDSIVGDEVIALLKDEASEAAARGGGMQGPSAGEIRRSIDQLDGETVREFVGHLVDGDVDAATTALADNIALSERDLRRMVERASRQVQQMLGTAGNDQPLSEDILNRAKSTLAAGIDDIASPGGSDVSRRDIRSAIDDLDREVLQTIGWRLVQGDADGARNALVANTSLSRAEADDLIRGVEANMDETVDRYREQVEEYADTAGDYAQGVLWVAFFATTLSLAASALGGWVGTRPVTRRGVRTEDARVVR